MGGSTLGGRVGVGDRDAFAAMYEEFADPVFGTCVSILRDREEAADATQDVFVLALQRIGQLRDPGRLRPWLFAIARHVCFRRLRERGRAQPVESVELFVALDDDASNSVSADEAAAVIWAAASGLSERDRAVLFLNIVQGLEGDDLAAALGVKQANPHSLLYRAKVHLDRAVGVLAVSRIGRRDCASLDALLAKWDGTLTPILRKRVSRHIDDCETCTRTKARAFKLPALTAAMLSVAGQAQALTGGEMFEIAARRPASRERWQRDGFPPLDERGRRRRFAWLSVTALGVALLVVLLATTLGSADATPARRPVAASPPNAVAVPTTRRADPSTTVAPAPTTTLIAGITAATPTTVRSVGGRGPVAPQAGSPIIGGAATVAAPTVPAPVHNGPAPTRPPATTPQKKPPPPPPPPPPTLPPTTTTTIHT